MFIAVIMIGIVVV